MPRGKADTMHIQGASMVKRGLKERFAPGERRNIK